MTIRFDYEGKHVLVTGGSQGIGLGIARAFVEAGADVAITGTRTGPEAYDGDLSAFRYHQLRLDDAGQRAAFADRFGDLDILVNNAGQAIEGEYALDGYMQTMEVNLNAAVDLCYRFHARLKYAGGAIVNVGSGASYIAIRKHPAYTASKTGLLGFTRAIADAWAPDGIRVNLVAPGFIDTRMTEWVASDARWSAGILAAIPAGRQGVPEDVAMAVLFLAAPEANYVRGQGLVVDGGMLLR